MAKTARKFKLKKDNKKISSIKRSIALIGEDSDGDYIFMNIKSKSFDDKNYNDLKSKIFKEIRLPVKEKRFIEMSEIEKDLYKLKKNEDSKNKLILCYDETNPKFVSIKSEIEKMEIVARLVTYFDMDALIEDEEGNEINNWQRFGIGKNNWFALCKYVMSEEGLGLSEGDMIQIQSEVNEMKIGRKTLGEKMMDNIEMENETEKAIENSVEELNKELEEIKSNLDVEEAEIVEEVVEEIEE